MDSNSLINANQGIRSLNREEEKVCVRSEGQRDGTWWSLNLHFTTTKTFPFTLF